LLPLRVPQTLDTIPPDRIVSREKPHGAPTLYRRVAADACRSYAAQAVH